ncbi:tRNA splicing endonuclease subunit sen2 [Coemansia sp. RSA 1822]|nr:tRNA splicing endonuclease subunit sen2 [Coemansia sp. RSA 638]KAJ2564902.1 tRNA splicing endonuclease subunit sen2 [Coemansia sp. RSA 1822]
MSRSDPTWLGRYRRAMDGRAYNGQRFIEDITAKRREARRDHVNGQTPDALHLETMRDLNIASTDAPSMEPMQLSPFEALFLNTLECLEVRDSDHHICSHAELWQLLAASSKQADEFALKYAAYFYYRTRGWTVKSGIKFGADFLLYSKGGPSSSHAQYSVIVRRQDTRGTVDESWQYMFALSRVCSQVRKALIVCYVDRPTAENDCGVHEHMETTAPDLTEFQINEFLIERFNPNRK